MTFNIRAGAARALCVLILSAMTIGSAEATVTYVANYRLGEADPGAVAGGTSSGTVDSSGNGNDLTAVGSPLYSSNVMPGSQSSLSATFDGNSYFVGNTVTDATRNFGIVARVNWALGGGDPQGIAINGNGCCSGFGLFEQGGAYYGLYGGQNVIPIATVPSGWVEIALVDEDGITTTYLNGVVQTSGNYGGPDLASHVGGTMSIGSDTSNNFDGMIDSVRVFTFADGQFRVADLDVPEPITLSLFGAGLAGAAALRRRRAKKA